MERRTAPARSYLARSIVRPLTSALLEAVAGTDAELHVERAADQDDGGGSEEGETSAAGDGSIFLPLDRLAVAMLAVEAEVREKVGASVPVPGARR